MDLYLIFNIVLVFNILPVIKTTTCKGYEHCFCSKPNKFTCTNTDYIPTPPSYVITVNLNGNFFPNINRRTFRNIASNKILTLVMRNNSIQTIKRDSFSDLRYLIKLEISHEKNLRVTEVQSSFVSLNGNTLKELHLENNTWKKLPMNMFQHLHGANLSSISLNNNKLSKLHSGILRPLETLHHLNLVKNAIAFVNTRYLDRVHHLDLSGNNIWFVPKFCVFDQNKIVIPQQLQSLYLTNNVISDISANSLDCLNKLEILNLDGNRIDALKNNIFSRLPKLGKLSISRIHQLKTIEPEAFNITSLRILSFSQNGFHFDKIKNYFPQKIFHYLRNLQELDLSNNVFSCNNLTNLLAVVLPLHQLRKLVLIHVGLCYIPDIFFKMMPNLEILNLSGNKLASWNDTVFKNVTSLQVLNLQGNKIHIINETSFPWEILNSLKSLGLSDNPYGCSCDQKWFLNTVRYTNLSTKLVSWPKSYICFYPEHLRFTKLSDYHPTYIECNLLTIVIISVSTTVFVIFLIVAVVLRCQINIRNALYFIHVYRRMKNGYLKLESSDDYEYDVFIVYCDADRQWVHTDLLQFLETSGSNVCVHLRDFHVGEHITTNIESFMDRSWKIVLVMSNNFAESEWCQWEVDLILERRRKQGKQAVILIMYQQIDSLHMTSPLRSLLDTTPHLSFVQGFGQKLFWKTLLRAVNKSLSLPPTAIQ